MNKPAGLPKQLKIIKIGDAAGVLLPDGVLQQLQLEIGDTLSLVETSDGVALSATSEHEQQMTAARSIMKRYRNALSELAK